MIGQRFPVPDESVWFIKAASTPSRSVCKGLIGRGFLSLPAVWGWSYCPEDPPEGRRDEPGVLPCDRFPQRYGPLLSGGWTRRGCRRPNVPTCACTCMHVRPVHHETPPSEDARPTPPTLKALRLISHLLFRSNPQAPGQGQSATEANPKPEARPTVAWWQCQGAPDSAALVARCSTIQRPRVRIRPGINYEA